MLYQNLTVRPVLFGVAGDKNTGKTTLMEELSAEDAIRLINDGYIEGGMLPKLRSCIDALENGVSRIHILDGRIPHCLLLEIFTNKGIGTAILNDKECRYYHG